MANRNYKTEGSEAMADVWGVTSFTKAGCYLLDRYAAEAKTTPSKFLGTLMDKAFKAHIAAHPLGEAPNQSEQPSVTEQPQVESAGEAKLELVTDSKVTETVGKAGRKRNRRQPEVQAA